MSEDTHADVTEIAEKDTAVSFLPAQTAETPLSGLIDRMNRGDREAAALFLTKYGPLIQRRIRGKLFASLRRVADSGDILSTLGRRLDLYVMRGRFACHSEAELWSLVQTIARRSTIEKARILNSINRLEREDGPLARRFQESIQSSLASSDGAIELAWDDLMEMLHDETDREIAFHWTLGSSHEEIAEIVRLSPAAVRKRWERAKAVLRDRLEVGRL